MQENFRIKPGNFAMLQSAHVSKKRSKKVHLKFQRVNFLNLLKEADFFKIFECSDDFKKNLVFETLIEFKIF